MRTVIRAALLAFAAATLAVTSAAARNADIMANGHWITLKGTVVSVKPDAFVLDFSDGTVTVTTKGWNWGRKPMGIVVGDEVNVYGYVDRSGRKAPEIDASAVYVERLDLSFHANDVGQHDRIGARFRNATATTNATGTVTAIKGRRFTLDRGGRSLTVDTSGMYYDPMDRRGYLRVAVGERLTVSGHIDRQGVMLPNTIVTLAKTETRNKVAG